MIHYILSDTEKGKAFEADIRQFLREWNNDSPFITIHTSGSTGSPRPIQVRKEQMRASARLTCSYLQVMPGERALLCLPMQYIAGKMMVVRAIEAGLKLIACPPSNHPLAELEESVQLAAMTPSQLYNSLQIDSEREKLGRIEKLLIGGGGLDGRVEEQLRRLPNKIYMTYGMAETLSHIALRAVTGVEASEWYSPLPGVTLSCDSDRRLIIEAPLVADETIHTNDVVILLPDGRFRILGRVDNIINSSGIKIQIEPLEEQLRKVISTNFAITAVNDPQWGEAVVLLLEGTTVDEALKGRIREAVPPKHFPKRFLSVEKIPLTASGKINRAACRKLAQARLEG